MTYQKIVTSPTISEASTLINVEDSSDEITLTEYDDIKKKLNVNIKDEYSFKDFVNYLIPSRETIKLGLLILGWYLASALHSNYSKKVLKQYKHPITMTYIQFFSIALYNFFSHILGFTKLKPLSMYVIKQTLPLSIFQIGGHLLNSYSLSLVSVNFVQTIKALSPLFIIGIYRIVFHESYSKETYISLVPLICGVMLVCFNKSTFNAIGFICASLSCFIFAAQNVFTKKVLSNYRSKAEKLDKFNVLFYFSLQAFILLTPWWLKVDGYQIITNGIELDDSVDKKSLLINIIVNTIFNFFQSCCAFTLIYKINPVSYSIAGLVKRIFVITITIIFFGDHVTFIQGVGIIITFIGLFMYHNARNNSRNEKSGGNNPKEKHNRLFKKPKSLIKLIHHNKNILPVSNKEVDSEKEQ